MEVVEKPTSRNNSESDSKRTAMHLVVLCAGYGTRLARDIEAAKAKAASYAHLAGIPKPLLPVAGRGAIQLTSEFLHK